ncbi:hypothetical protein Tco_0625694 [Tanacetum coccineum]|uniref:Reverse transcriptase domain-containing protein n=1 Tax=Tanacetum coccineum TaxID=301880 RepID=A0ABQ4WHL6_9ASTR
MGDGASKHYSGNGKFLICECGLSITSPKIDFLPEEFVGELDFIDPILPGIDKDDCDEDDFDEDEGENDNDILQIDDEILREKLLNVNLLVDKIKALKLTLFIPFVLENPFSSPIPVVDSDFLVEEVDTFLVSKDSIPPGIESDLDSEGDIVFLDNLLNDDPIPDYEGFTYDIEPDAPVINNFDELNKDECFDPGGEPVVSHRDGTFMCFNVYPNINERVEPDQGGLISIVISDNSNDPLLELPEFESFHFDPSFPHTPSEPPDVEISLIIETDAPVINNFDELNEDECFDPGGGEIDVEDDDSFTFIIRTFLSFLTYPADSPLLLSTGSEDTIFDPDIFT